MYYQQAVASSPVAENLEQESNAPFRKFVPELSRTAQYVKTTFLVLGLITASLFIIARVGSPTGSSSSSGNELSFAVNPSSPKMFGGDEIVFDVHIATEQTDYNSVDLSQLPWDALVEPNKPQTLKVTAIKIDGKVMPTSLYSFKWVIDGQVHIGNTATVNFEKTGVVAASVRIAPTTPAPQQQVLTHEFKLAVKYIRRELRSLTETDRKTFFDALYKMYTVPAHVGVEKYGSKFKTAEQHLWKHLNGAGTSDCDHWHDGAGIATHHIAYTLEVEQTLQAINPSIAMPYWEFSKDAESGNTYDQAEHIYDPDWFGEANPQNPQHEIRDGGMWEGIALPDGTPYKNWDIAATGSLNPFVNAYGMMRSPWNNNPSKYIGRCNETYHAQISKNYPACSEMRQCFNSKTISDMNECINGYTHGPVHILIGGSWNEGSVLDGYDYMRNPDRLLLFKIMWRTGFTRCPTSCDASTMGDPEACKCAVPQEYIDKYGALEILKQTNIYYVYEQFLKDASDDVLLRVLRIHEDPGHAGEMFTSAASFDPTFWPLHGAAERMLSYKRLLIANGVFEQSSLDETWGYPTYNKASGAAYLSGKCDWSNVKGPEDLTLPVCDEEAVCEGHGADDVLEFDNFLNKGEKYTNRDLYTFVHPHNDDLPYVYDTYGYDYCADIGQNFLEEMDEEESSEPDIVPPGTSTTAGKGKGKRGGGESDKKKVPDSIKGSGMGR